MRSRLRSDLTAALKARDRVAVAALRSALAAIENAEAVDPTGQTATEVDRRVLTVADVERLVRAQVDERRAAAEEYDRLRRPDHARRLRAEADVLRRYLR